MFLQSNKLTFEVFLIVYSIELCGDLVNVKFCFMGNFHWLGKLLIYIKYMTPMSQLSKSGGFSMNNQYNIVIVETLNDYYVISTAMLIRMAPIIM